MAIVEGKSGMQIGNMPSIDAVTQDGFIIYSDDGIHTYKMTIAEFAQAIGVVMTGGGDGDGGDGLAYWKEESKRIFRDLMSSNENEFRTIKGSAASTNVFRTQVTYVWGFTTDGTDHSASIGALMIFPVYNGNRLLNDLEKDVAKCLRFPALDSLLTMPESKYYCNYTNPADRPLAPYSKLCSWQTYEDIVVNPPIKISEPTYVGIEPYSVYEENISRVDCGGQDRRFFGYINLNVNKTQRMQNPTYDGTYMGTFTGESYEEVVGKAEARKSQAHFIEDEYPVTGTAEYIFSLYCVGAPNEKVKAKYTQNNTEKEFEYYPWGMITQHYYRYPYRFNGARYELELNPYTVPPTNSVLCPLPRDSVYIQDKKTGKWMSPYYRPLRSTTPSQNPPTYEEGINTDTHVYYDKSDIGAAYFTDDDGTMWYVVLTPRSRASRSFWDEKNRVAPSIITTDPIEFDKAPQYLPLDQTYTHWCYDGSDSLDDYTLGDGGWKTTPRQRQNTDEWYGVYSGYAYSLKYEKFEIYNERIQTIGKAILNALGLKGITPLELSASGIHSEISATADSVLNGGKYTALGNYIETYNLNGVDGSLYLSGDAYDNGKKLKDAYQKKLTPGEGIAIEEDVQTGDLIISSDGGGGGSVDIEADYDNSTKDLDITGFSGKKIQFVNEGGIHTEIYGGHDGKSDNVVSLKPCIDFAPNGQVTGQVLSSPAAYKGMLKFDLNSNYHNSTQRRLQGGKHVYIYGTGASQPGNTPSTSGGNDALFTDCIDTIKVNGVEATKQYDSTNQSYYVNLSIPGAGVSPFTVDIGGNYGGNGYIETGFSSFTKIGQIYLQPNNNYCWIEVEVAMYVNSTDSIAADSVITMELRPYGFSGDICDPPASLNNRSLQLTDSKHIIHSADGPVWNKISVSGLVNYSGSDPLRLDVNVKQNSGINKYVKWKAGVAYVPVSS